MSQSAVLDKREQKIQTKIKTLIKSGKKEGFLPYDTIIEAFESIKLTPEEFDAIWNELDSNDIAVRMEEPVNEKDELDGESISEGEMEEVSEAEIEKDLAEIDQMRGSADIDIVRLYLRDIGKIELLTAEEEIELSKLIEAKKQAESKNLSLQKQIDALKDESISAAGEKKILSLEKQIRKNDLIIERGLKAAERLATCNLRLVVSIAKRYVGHGLTFMDLIQEGNIGLIKSIEKFDYRKGYKFSTYSTWWIRQAITRSIADSGRTVRLPVHLNEVINRISKTRKDLTQELGREPKIAEIAEEVDMTVERVNTLLTLSMGTVSLEMPVGEEGDNTLADFVQDYDSPSPADLATELMMREQILDIVNALPEREREIIILRFGLMDGRQRTLEEVGKVFNVTRERIRQIEAKALKRLRHPARSKQIREYLQQ